MKKKPLEEAQVEEQEESIPSIKGGGKDYTIC